MIVSLESRPKSAWSRGYMIVYIPVKKKVHKQMQETYEEV